MHKNDVSLIQIFKKSGLHQRIMGATKKICTFLRVENFSKNYFRKGQNYSET